MGLPANKSAWPPAEHTSRYSRMRTHSTWYGGDPEKLVAMYGGSGAPSTRTRTGLRGALQSAFGWFWGTSDSSAPDSKIHVPLAQDIATMSSELLFADPAKFTVQHTRFLQDGTPDPTQDVEVATTQARLDDLLDYSGFDSVLLATAEVGAVLGSSGLRLAWDKNAGTTMPRILRADADEMVPEYRWGELVAVTFWTALRHDGETIWYHLERHERGRILHGLYEGTLGNLGRAVPLDDLAATAPLAKLVDADGAIATVPGAITALSIPNMLPDPLDRKGNAGRSDFTPGVLTLFDAIDKTYTSLMRDIDDARSRLIIADYMLESKGAGQGVEWDADQHIFTKLKMAPTETGDVPITQVQFKIRVEEHIKAIELLTMRAIKGCGYSSDAEQGDAGGEMTATEYSGKAKRSLATRAKKLRYWQQVEGLLFGLLQVDAAYFQSGIVPLPVKMEAAPGVQESMKNLAETAEAMLRAEASSIRVRVQHLHPDWDDSEVDAEVELIQAESGVVDPTTFGLPGDPAAPGGPLLDVEEPEGVEVPA